MWSYFVGDDDAGDGFGGDTGAAAVLEAQHEAAEAAKEAKAAKAAEEAATKAAKEAAVRAEEQKKEQARQKALEEQKRKDEEARQRNVVRQGELFPEQKKQQPQQPQQPQEPQQPQQPENAPEDDGPPSTNIQTLGVIRARKNKKGGANTLASREAASRELKRQNKAEENKRPHEQGKKPLPPTPIKEDAPPLTPIKEDAPPLTSEPKDSSRQLDLAEENREHKRQDDLSLSPASSPEPENSVLDSQPQGANSSVSSESPQVTVSDPPSRDQSPVPLALSPSPTAGSSSSGSLSSLVETPPVFSGPDVIVSDPPSVPLALSPRPIADSSSGLPSVLGAAPEADGVPRLLPDLPPPISVVEPDAEPPAGVDPQLWESLTNRLDGIDGLRNNHFYKTIILGSLLDKEAKHTPSPEILISENDSSYQNLLQANCALGVYLANEEKQNRQAFTPNSILSNLKLWYRGISHRITPDSLNVSQRAELIELIYTNLTIALVHDWKTEQKSENTVQSYMRPDCIDRAVKLNENISYWNGWKVVAGICVGILGLAMIGVAGLSIAASYGAALPVWAMAIASWNGGAVGAAVLYLIGCNMAQCRKSHQENKRKEVNGGGSDAAIQQSLGRGMAEAGVCVIGGIVSVVFAAFNVIQSATLSLGKNCSVKASTTNVFPPYSLDSAAVAKNFAAAGIHALMLLVAGVGVRAVRKGGRMVKNQWNKCNEDAKTRGHGSEFFKVAAPDVVAQQKNQGWCSRLKL